MNYPESTTELDVCAGKCNRESQDEQVYWACIAECEAKQVALATDTEPDGGETEIWRGYFGSEDAALAALLPDVTAMEGIRSKWDVAA
jgi:hypothetical protein